VVVQHSLPLLDELLAPYREAIGRDFPAYRNHTYRVVHFCRELGVASDEAMRKVMVAAAFHDLGIWTARTFDYIAPSLQLAVDYLSRTNRRHWESEVAAMIREHHKVTDWASEPGDLVELFRRADWIDVTHGLRRFGLAGRQLREVFRTFPDAGFHWRLVQLTAGRALRHPLAPLPMFHW